jgi:hypothetical protein
MARICSGGGQDGVKEGEGREGTEDEGLEAEEHVDVVYAGHGSVDRRLMWWDLGGVYISVGLCKQRLSSKSRSP